MTDDRTKRDLKSFQELNDSQVYIYIMKNEAGKVKVGLTKNINNRYKSLCGSNSQGVAINSVYVSSPTYLFSLEKILHFKMRDYRIPNTEWFYYKEDETGQILYDSAIECIERLVNSGEYRKCNEVRRKYVLKES